MIFNHKSELGDHTLNCALCDAYVFNAKVLNAL